MSERELAARKAYEEAVAPYLKAYRKAVDKAYYAYKEAKAQIEKEAEGRR